jgi:hypothetical protein
VNRQHDRLVNSVLLEPVHDPEDYALAVVRQVEGGAALRYRTPEARDSAQILDVEVAWNNLLEGTLRRARIPSAGAYQPGDYIKSNGRTQTAQPNLLSIATGGVYVRLHQAASTDQVAYYLDGRRVTTVPRMSWPAALGHRAHSEMARVGGQDAHLLVAGDGAVVALARLSSGNWEPAACTIGLEQPGLFGLTQLVDITYLGGQPAIHFMLSAAAGAVQAFAFPLLASGPAVGAPVALPSQDRATDPPQACTDDMVRTSPRIVVPPVATTRHAVVVDDVDEPPHVMLTSRAVMHGTADVACVDALEASSVNLPDSQPVEEQAVIDLRDLKRSWLFRKIEREKVEVVEARSMACSFDPKAEVPEELGEALRRMGRRRR